MAYNKNKLYKTFGLLLIHSLEGGLGIVIPPNFVYDFSRKMFLSSILLTDQISLFGCFYFVIAIVSQPGCDVINFETNFIFLIKPFLYMSKQRRQKFEYLEKEKRF